MWDYSNGNPGIALHFWRRSLALGSDGEPTVRLFSPPDTSDIEKLPDSALFVLRAILQVEIATVDDIVDATMLPSNSVRDSLRYGMSRGYVESHGQRFRIHWGWLRAITSFLQRRHLLLGKP